MGKSLIGIALILFAILLQLCIRGVDYLAFGIGIIGLVFTIYSARKSE